MKSKNTKYNKTCSSIFIPTSTGKTPSVGLLWARRATSNLLNPDNIKNIKGFLKLCSWDPRWDRVNIDSRFCSANRIVLINMMLQILEYYKNTITMLEENYFRQDIYKMEYTDWGQKEHTVPWNKEMISQELTYHGCLFFLTGLKIYRKIIKMSSSSDNIEDFEDSILDPDTPYVIKTSIYQQVLQDYRLSTTKTSITETSMAAGKSWNSEKYHKYALFKDEIDPLE